MGTIILTSQGFYNKKIIDKFKELAKNVVNSPAVVISTASDEKNKNKWVKKAKDQLIEYGYSDVDIVDIEFESDKDLSRYKTIYVAGGNGFRLTKIAKATKFDEVIKQCINNDGIYIGVSAGSILLAPSIQLAAEFEPEKVPSDMRDFSGLGLVPDTIMPHYEPGLESKLTDFEKKYGYKLVRLTNDNALIYENVNINRCLL